MRRSAHRSDAFWPELPSSAVSVTRMRVSGSSCAPGAAQGARAVGAQGKHVVRRARGQPAARASFGSRLTQLLRRRVAPARTRQALALRELLCRRHEASSGAARCRRHHPLRVCLGRAHAHVAAHCGQRARQPPEPHGATPGGAECARHAPRSAATRNATHVHNRVLPSLERSRSRRSW
jgi:hypothetical protein